MRAWASVPSTGDGWDAGLVILDSSNELARYDVPLSIEDAALSAMRSRETSSKDFRTNLNEIAMLMGYEVSRDLKTKTVEFAPPIWWLLLSESRRFARPIPMSISMWPLLTSAITNPSTSLRALTMRATAFLEPNNWIAQVSAAVSLKKRT